MAESKHANSDEEFRLCPTCRMPISVLATKCRFCGMEVGRPRQKEVRYSIQDLGGETRAMYQPSSDVTEALEQFRAEEFGQFTREFTDPNPLDREPMHHSGSSNPQSSGPGQSGGGGGDLPDLDARSRELAELVAGARPVSTSRPKPKPGPPEWVRYAGMIAGGILGVLLIFYGGSYVAEILGGSQEEAPRVHNRAPEIIAAGGDPVAALDAALEAWRVTRASEHAAILEEARQYVLDHVEALLSEEPWAAANHRNALSIITRAAHLDGDSSLQEMRVLVEREVSAYNLVLVDVDREAGTARFMLNDPFADETEQTVRVGERVNNRFIVRSISSNQVRLEDPHYELRSGAGRPLRSHLRGVLRGG